MVPMRRCQRAAKTASSLPRVVGEAGWPWVWLGMGRAAYASACAHTSSTRASASGSHPVASPSRSMRAWAMLLMSSEVQAKCTNSAPGPKPMAASFSLR